MGASSSAMAVKEKRITVDATYLLPLVTFTPVPNVLEKLTQGQRELFFSTMRELSNCRRMENSARNESILRQQIRLSGAEKQTGILESKAKAHQVATIQASPSSWQPEQQMKVVRLPGASSQQMGASDTIASAAVPSIAMPLPIQAQHAASALSVEVNSYSIKDEETACGVVSEFESRVKNDNYKSDDLMAVLLLVIEDDLAGEIPSGGVGGASGASRFGGIASRAGASAIPEELRTTAMESVETRLASVREMLRYYFLKHPKDFKGALAAALGITADQEEDRIFLQERMASALASIGSFALAQKVLAELKLKKKMDTEKCLLELGYRYDVKRKRLVLGKRTCGTKVEAKGIISALLGRLSK